MVLEARTLRPANLPKASDMCFGFKLHRSKRAIKRNDSDENVALTVHVHAWNQAGIKIPKVAVLWYPGAHNEVDLISPKLVAEVLCLEIQTSGKRRKGLPWGTRGHVEVEWGLENSDTTRCTRFMVVSMYDPPFDLLLGKTTALECGLTRE